MIENLKTGNALGTAHIYQASKNAFITFLGKEEIHFRQIKPELLKRFEYFLRSRGNSWNTVSTYMRVLRAVYNRAVDRKLAPYMPDSSKRYTPALNRHQTSTEAGRHGTIAQYTVYPETD